MRKALIFITLIILTSGCLVQETKIVEPIPEVIYQEILDFMNPHLEVKDSHINNILIYFEVNSEQLNNQNYNISIITPKGIAYSENTFPNNWDTIIDSSQGYAYFSIPQPDVGLWQLKHNEEIDAFKTMVIESPIQLSMSIKNQEEFERVLKPNLNIEIIDFEKKLLETEVYVHVRCILDDDNYTDHEINKAKYVSNNTYSSTLKIYEYSKACIITSVLKGHTENEIIMRKQSLVI